MASPAEQVFDRLFANAAEKATEDLETLRPEGEEPLTDSEREVARAIIGIGVLRGMEAVRHFLRFGIVPDVSEFKNTEHAANEVSSSEFGSQS